MTGRWLELNVLFSAVIVRFSLVNQSIEDKQIFATEASKNDIIQLRNHKMANKTYKDRLFVSEVVIAAKRMNPIHHNFGNILGRARFMYVVQTPSELP